MNIPDILPTKERVSIVRQIIYKKDSFNVSKIARELNLSKGLVSKLFGILSDENIITRKANNFYVQDNLNVKALKLLLNFEHFNIKLFAKYKFVKSAGVYGSFAKGENNDESDIDLWLYIIKAKDTELAKLTNELKKEYPSVNILYLTKEKIAVLKKQDTIFYHSLVFGSIGLFGGKLDGL